MILGTPGTRDGWQPTASATVDLGPLSYPGRQGAPERLVQIWRSFDVMVETVVPTSEVRAALGKITRRFDAGDSERGIGCELHRAVRGDLASLAGYGVEVIATVRDTPHDLAQAG